MSMRFKSKKELENAIRESITTNPKRAIDAMLRIFEYQTADEQACGTVSKLNGVGFVCTDAPILTSFCERYKKFGNLTERQIEFLMKKIGKYAKQLTTQAIEKGLYVKEGNMWVVNKSSK